MNILAIDTSADETSAAVTSGFRVLSSTLSSQISSHKAWGGIVPSIARLAHEERIDGVVEDAIRKARLIFQNSKFKIQNSKYGQSGNNLPKEYLFWAVRWGVPTGTAQTKHGIEGFIDAVAVTYGPGLSIALEVGIKKAKELSLAWGVPLIAVNHMEGHLYSPFVQNSKGNPAREVIYPFLSLLISGGHTQIVLAKDNGVYEIVGETVDDAAGEALDKAAKMLGLGYPGGPVIEKLAKDVKHIDLYKFPRPMRREESCMMSFSGLKTHLYYFLKGQKGQAVSIEKDLHHLASSFQEAVFDTVLHKLDRAMRETGVNRLAVGGGVSINKRLRTRLRALARTHSATVVFPPYPYLCGDNAAMIGVAAHMMAKRGEYVKDIIALDRVPRARLGMK